MKTGIRLGSVLALLLVACGSNDSRSGTAAAGTPAQAKQPDWVVPAGYDAFPTEAVTVAPGDSGQWIQWVKAPLDHDVNIVDVVGRQGIGGHHAIFYAMTDVQPVGTAREWKDDDQLKARFLGGIGGEAGAAVKLPAGAVFRLHAGEALAIQTHYLNTSEESLEATSELDAQFGEPAASDRVASILGSADMTFQVPVHGTLHDELRCTVKDDVSVLMIANHMHAWGTKASTRLETGSTTTMLKDDPVWHGEWSANPNFDIYSVEKPLVIPAGSTLVTECDWANDTNRVLTFPAEMCALVTFYLGDHDTGCVTSH
jgi:hypothetical protein